MKALLFLVRRMILNWIKELKKHPGAAIFYILLLAFISFSVIPTLLIVAKRSLSS